MEEVQLSIAGTIPRTGKVLGAAIDNRNTSMMLHIGNVNTVSLRDAQILRVRFVAVNGFRCDEHPSGRGGYANEISKAIGRNSSLYTFTRQVKTSGALAPPGAAQRDGE